MNSEQLAALTGLTMRQIDHWTHLGYLKPVGGGGSGHPRDYGPGEVYVAGTMARLRRAGLEPQAAHRVARGETELAPGVRVVFGTGEQVSA